MSEFTVGKIVLAPKVDDHDEKLINEIIAANKKPEKLVSVAELLQTIERQQSRIADYQAACEQKQEIINGMQEQVADQQAEIERLRKETTAQYEQIEEFKLTIAHVLFNLGIIQKGGGCKVECKQRVSMLVEVLKHE